MQGIILAPLWLVGSLFDHSDQQTPVGYRGGYTRICSVKVTLEDATVVRGSAQMGAPSRFEPRRGNIREGADESRSGTLLQIAFR